MLENSGVLTPYVVRHPYTYIFHKNTGHLMDEKQKKCDYVIESIKIIL